MVPLGNTPLPEQMFTLLYVIRWSHNATMSKCKHSFWNIVMHLWTVRWVSIMNHMNQLRTQTKQIKLRQKWKLLPASLYISFCAFSIKSLLCLMESSYGYCWTAGDTMWIICITSMHIYVDGMCSAEALYKNQYICIKETVARQSLLDIRNLTFAMLGPNHSEQIRTTMLLQISWSFVLSGHCLSLCWIYECLLSAKGFLYNIKWYLKTIL